MSTEYVSVPMLRKLLGVEAARDLLAAFGGSSLYVAAKQRENGPLALAIGIDSAKILAEYFTVHSYGFGSNKMTPGGINISIPMGPDAARRKRQQKMADLLQKGELSISQIARECECSVRNVYMYKSKMKNVAVAPLPSAAA